MQLLLAEYISTVALVGGPLAESFQYDFSYTIAPKQQHRLGCKTQLGLFLSGPVHV